MFVRPFCLNDQQEAMVPEKTLSSRANRTSWKAEAIAQAEQLASLTAKKIYSLKNAVPAALASIATSDDSSSSDSTESDESSQAAFRDFTDVTEFTDVSLSKRGRVEFTTVKIREYAVVIGDHPLANMYPLTLDWPFVESDPQSIESYESRKHFFGSVNRNGSKALRLTVMERMARLTDVMGCSSQELYTQERERQLRVQEEKCRVAMHLQYFQ